MMYCCIRNMGEFFNDRYQFMRNLPSSLNLVGWTKHFYGEYWSHHKYESYLRIVRILSIVLAIWSNITIQSSWGWYRVKKESGTVDECHEKAYIWEKPSNTHHILLTWLLWIFICSGLKGKFKWQKELTVQSIENYLKLFPTKTQFY